MHLSFHFMSISLVTRLFHFLKFLHFGSKDLELHITPYTLICTIHYLFQEILFSDYLPNPIDGGFQIPHVTSTKRMHRFNSKGWDNLPRPFLRSSHLCFFSAPTIQQRMRRPIRPRLLRRSTGVFLLSSRSLAEGRTT